MKMKAPKYMYNCDCGCKFKIVKERVEKVWEVHGYKFEGYVYYINCPRCHTRKKVTSSRIPINVLWKLRK